MSRYISEQTAYDPQKKKSVPLWRLDTGTMTVTHFNADAQTEEHKTYHTDFIRYHLHFSDSHCPDRLRRLINEGKIEQYLDDMELKVSEAISRQVELWKQTDSCYHKAVLSGDAEKMFGLENCFVYMKLKEITTPKLTSVMKTFDLKPQSVRKIYVVIQSIFRRGVEQGFIRESPCHNVILPKRRCEKKKMSLDENEIKRFMELLDTKPWDEDFKRIIKVLLYTGMRSGECLGLMWEDIDFEEMTITINHNLTDIGGRHELSSPKTESSRRVIGMSDVLASIFREQKTYIDKMSAALGKRFAHPEMVFTSALGNYRDRNSVYHSLKRFTKGTEFENLTLHQLRHCNATLLLNSGIDLKIVSEHLGHCDIGVTIPVPNSNTKPTQYIPTIISYFYSHIF